MICQNCKDTRHTLCKGRTWCDCQHRDGADAAWQELVALGQQIEAGEYTIGVREGWGESDGPDLRQPEAVQDAPVPGPE